MFMIPNSVRIVFYTSSTECRHYVYDSEQREDCHVAVLERSESKIILSSIYYFIVLNGTGCIIKVWLMVV